MRLIYVWIVMGMAFGSLAQEPPLTLKHALEMTIERHPRLLALRHDLLAACYQVQSAGALRSAELLLVPELSPGGTDNALLLTQPLELNGTRRARSQMAHAGQEAIYQQSLIEGSLLLSQVQTAYYHLAHARQVRRVQEEILQALSEMEQSVRRQVELGVRAGVDAMQVELERLRQQQVVEQARFEETGALAELNQWLVREPLHPVELAPLPAVSAGYELPAALASPETDREYALMRQRLAEKALEQSLSLPDLFLQFRLERLSSHARPGLAIGLSMPLVDYGARRNRLRELEQQIRAQSERANAAQRQTGTLRTQAQEQVRVAWENLHTYEGGIIEKARLFLEAQQKGYALGQTDLLRLLEAQRTYKTVLIEGANAQAKYRLALTEYQRVTGEFLPMCETLLTKTIHFTKEERK